MSCMVAAWSIVRMRDAAASDEQLPARFLPIRLISIDDSNHESRFVLFGFQAGMFALAGSGEPLLPSIEGDTVGMERTV